MDENLHGIDQFFKDSLEGHEEAPPAHVWNALDNDLDKHTVAAITKKYNHLKIVAAALLALLVGSIAWHFLANQSSKTENENVVDKQEHPFKKDVTPEDNSGKNKSLPANVSADVVVNEFASKSAGNEYANKELQRAGSPKNVEAASNNTQGKKQHMDTVNKFADDPKPSPKRIQKKVVNTAMEITTFAKSNSGNKKSKDEIFTKDVKVNLGKEEMAFTIGDMVNKHNKKFMGYKPGQTLPVKNDELFLTENKNENTRFYANHFLPADSVITERKAFDASVFRLNKLQVNADRLINERQPVNNITIVKNSRLTTPHVSVMPFYSPHISFNRIESDDHDGRIPGGDHERDEIKKGEQTEAAYSFGVLMAFPIAKKWNVQTGITYSVKNTGIEPKPVFAALDDFDGSIKYRFDFSSGYTYFSPKTGNTPSLGDSARLTASANNLRYLRIPVSLQYRVGSGKFYVMPSMGAGFNFLVKQKIETELVEGLSKGKQVVNNIRGIKAVYFNAISGIAFEYNLSRRLELDLIPSANFALSAINENGAVKSYPNTFEIAAGIKLNFLK